MIAKNLGKIFHAHSSCSIRLMILALKLRKDTRSLEIRLTSKAVGRATNP
jgi:hypothetical protein